MAETNKNTVALWAATFFLQALGVFLKSFFLLLGRVLLVNLSCFSIYQSSMVLLLLSSLLLLSGNIHAWNEILPWPGKIHPFFFFGLSLMYCPLHITLSLTVYSESRYFKLSFKKDFFLEKDCRTNNEGPRLWEFETTRVWDRFMYPGTMEFANLLRSYKILDKILQDVLIRYLIRS